MLLTKLLMPLVKLQMLLKKQLNKLSDSFKKKGGPRTALFFVFGPGGIAFMEKS